MKNLIISLGLPLLLSLFLFSFTDRTPTKWSEKNPPNIIYILADDLGYGDIGTFNPEGKIATPHIDRLAKEGMKFTDAHSPSSVCTPTRYGIMTGRYSWRSALKSGVLTGKSKALIPKSRPTVASLLKERGYHTAFIGKWHLGWDWGLKDSAAFGGAGWDPEDFENIDFGQPILNNPNDLGFNYAYGHAGSLDMAPYVYVENGRITAPIKSSTENTGKYSWWRKGPTSADFIHEQVTPHFFRKSLDYIENRTKGTAPFFLYLALPSPHTPILPTEAWQDRSGLNPYADFVMMIDAYIGELVSKLDQQGLTENTLIIFTSDNGCSPQADFELLTSKGHHPSGSYRGHKADIFEGGHRIPFIAKWPSVIRPGTATNTTICLTDLMATCAEITGKPLPVDAGEDSFSLLPLFKRSTENQYAREATVHHSINGSFAIRKGPWKLIFCPDSGGWSDPKPESSEASNLPIRQLYQLEEDPGEVHNLYKAFPDIVKELETLMSSYIAQGRSTPGPKQSNASIDLEGKKWFQLETIVPQ